MQLGKHEHQNKCTMLDIICLCISNFFVPRSTTTDATDKLPQYLLSYNFQQFMTKKVLISKLVTCILTEDDFIKLFGRNEIRNIADEIFVYIDTKRYSALFI